MASVRKLKPNDLKSPWIVEYTDASGVRRRKTPKTGLKKDADALRQKIEREIEDAIHTPATLTCAFREVADIYLRAAEDRNRDGRLGKSRLLSLKWGIDKDLIPSFGDMKMTDINVSHLSAAYQRMVRARGLSPRTAKERIQIYRQVEDFAVTRGYLKKGIALGALAELRGVAKPAVRTFSRDDVQALLSAMDTRRFRTTDRIHRMVRCMVQLALFSGLRLGEIFGLTVENVDLQNRTIKVRHSLTHWDELKGPKTKAGIRDVPLQQCTADEIQAWLTKGYIANDRGLLFRARHGKS